MRHLVVLAVLALAVAACGDSAGGADPDRFCELQAELEEQGNTSEMAPDEALEVIEDGVQMVKELAAVAPDEIKDDVEMTTDVSLQISAVLIDAGGDESKVDESAMERIFTESFTEEFGGASERVDDWVAANCS